MSSALALTLISFLSAAGGFVWLVLRLRRRRRAQLLASEEAFMRRLSADLEAARHWQSPSSFSSGSPESRPAGARLAGRG